MSPAVAQRVVSQLIRDPMYLWHDVSLDIIRRAVDDWIARFHDQRFSLTDAVTFTLMKRERVTRAFAFDADFVTAGFDLLR